MSTHLNSLLLEDGSIWDSTNPEATFLSQRLQLCESCRNIMASPENIRALSDTIRGMPGPGIRICSEPKDEASACSARTIALAVVEAHNQAERVSPRVEIVGKPTSAPCLNIDPSKVTFKFNASRDSPTEQRWQDISQLQLRYDKQPVPLLEFDICALPGMHTTTRFFCHGFWQLCSYRKDIRQPRLIHALDMQMTLRPNT